MVGANGDPILLITLVFLVIDRLVLNQTPALLACVCVRNVPSPVSDVPGAEVVAASHDVCSSGSRIVSLNSCGMLWCGAFGGVGVAAKDVGAKPEEVLKESARDLHVPKEDWSEELLENHEEFITMLGGMGERAAKIKANVQKREKLVEVKPRCSSSPCHGVQKDRGQ